MRLLSRSFLVVATLLAAASIPSPAHAQPASTAETDRARELHKAGDVAFKAGKLEEARTAYLAAWALKKHWQIATNLGDAELRTGRPRDAAEHLAYALREGSEMSATQRDGVQKALDDAKTQVATIEVQIAPEGADVVIDGAFVGRSPLADPVFLAPGEHTVEVKKVGYVARSQKVQASAGAATPLRIELVAEGAAGAAPAPAPVTPPTAPPGDEVDDGPGVAPWILVGAGAAVAIGGGVLLGVGLSEQSSSADLGAAIVADGGSCEPASAGFESRCDELASSESTGNTLSGVGTGLLIGGGAAVVGGVVWMLVAPGASTDQGFVLTPIIAPGAAAFQARGQF